MFHGLGEMIDMGSASPWYPPGIVFIRKARAQRSSPGALFPWFECEKPVWWEVPVVMALEPPDSLGVLHNHFTEYGIYPYDGSVERPRDETKYPGDAGYVEYSLNLYYRYLNLGFGFRLRPARRAASSPIHWGTTGFTQSLTGRSPSTRGTTPFATARASSPTGRCCSSRPRRSPGTSST